MYHIFFTHSSVNGHLGCFYVLITVNSVAMRNAGLEEVQAGIKIAGRNINNLRYADDTTLMAKSEEQNLLRKVKEDSWLKTQHSEN